MSPSFPTPRSAAQPPTAEQAISRLTALCARSEQCSHDLRLKMRRWGMAQADIDEAIAYLTTHRYVDDERYARAFIHDKSEYNRWGRLKIEQALRMKGISRELAAPFFDELPADEIASKLRQLVAQKWRSTKAASDYERSQKVIRFALGRGYDYAQISLALSDIGHTDAEPDDF